ncbi:MAG: nucleoside deaminase [Brumimicrobium sp.]|nr:nucleoside deaminase [Brumimicrobium sp.]
MDENYMKWMRRCIELARIAKERGDSPVGSIVVKDGEIIGEGIEAGKTSRNVTRHAEIEAIQDAIQKGEQDFTDCIMVTTHEPCIMCSYVIRHHRIGKVVMGLRVGEIGGDSSSYPILRDTSISCWGEVPIVVSGILEEDCKLI